MSNNWYFPPEIIAMWWRTYGYVKGARSFIPFEFPCLMLILIQWRNIGVLIWKKGINFQKTQMEIWWQIVEGQDMVEGARLEAATIATAGCICVSSRRLIVCEYFRRNFLRNYWTTDAVIFLLNDWHQSCEKRESSTLRYDRYGSPYEPNRRHSHRNYKYSHYKLSVIMFFIFEMLSFTHLPSVERIEIEIKRCMLILLIPFLWTNKYNVVSRLR